MNGFIGAAVAESTVISPNGSRPSCASRSAGDAHIRSPHFISYKTSTVTMVESLGLVGTTPILLRAKSMGLAGGPVTCM